MSQNLFARWLRKISHSIRAIKHILMWRLGWLLLPMVVSIAIGFFVYQYFVKSKDIVPFIEHIAAGVIAVFTVTYLIERPLQNHYRRIKRLIPNQFYKEMGGAKSCVKIMDIWMKNFLLGKDSPGFKKAVIHAIRDGIDVHILVAKPNSSVASSRARTLSEGAIEFNNFSADDIQKGMGDCLVALDALYKEIDGLVRNKRSTISINTLQVRLFDKPVSLSMYRIDDKSYWNHYPYKSVSLKEVQYLTVGDHGPASFLNDHFEALWTDETTVDLCQYLEKNTN